MNDRIDEITDQCMMKYGVAVDPVKFAELIVKECVMLLYEDDGATHHRELLFTHFGVEE
jgi:hypothetical protein